MRNPTGTLSASDGTVRGVGEGASQCFSCFYFYNGGPMIRNQDISQEQSIFEEGGAKFRVFDDRGPSSLAHLD